jgi:Uncharacterized protein predicted to be involved in DNA repair
MSPVGQNYLSLDRKEWLSVGKTLYLMSSGTLKRKDNTLFIDKGESEKPRYLPVERTDEIMVFGEVDINKSLLEFLTQNQIILHFFNHYGYYAGLIIRAST